MASGNRLTLKVTGIRELAGAISNYSRAIVARGKARTETVTQRAVRRAKAAAPKDSGELQDKISGEIEYDAYGATGTLRSRARHSTFVEHGTEDTPRQPFFYPAAIQAQRELARGLSDDVTGLAPEGLGKPQIIDNARTPRTEGDR